MQGAHVLLAFVKIVAVLGGNNPLASVCPADSAASASWVFCIDVHGKQCQLCESLQASDWPCKCLACAFYLSQMTFGTGSDVSILARWDCVSGLTLLSVVIN